MPRPFALAFLLLAALPVHGEVIKGAINLSQATRDATYARFQTGSSTAANTSPLFTAAGLDLSGVGYLSTPDGQGGFNRTTLSVSLISDGYVIGANHVGAFSVGSQVTFVNSAGILVPRTITSVTTLTTTFLNNQGQPQTLPSDLRVAKLSATVTANDNGVMRVGVADPATNPAGLPVLVYGQNPVYGTDNFYLGRNTVETVQLRSFSLPDQNGNPQNEATIVADFRAGSADGNGYLTSGDSGGPLLARTVPDSDRPALVGVHYGVSNASVPLNSYPTDPAEIAASSYVPAYIDQINQIMQPDGYQVLVVPVPEPAGLLVVATLATVVWRRRRLAR